MVQRAAAARPRQWSYSLLGRNTGSGPFVEFISAAAVATSATSAAVGSSTPRSRAVRRSSRTPRPPERSSGGGCADHESARDSTSRRTSSTAVVPRRSSSAGDRSISGISGGTAPGAGRCSRSRRNRPTSRGSSTRCVSSGTSRPRFISRSAGLASASRPVRRTWRTAPTGGPAARRSRMSRSASSADSTSSATRTGSASTEAIAAPARGCGIAGNPRALSTGVSWTSGTPASNVAAGRPRFAGYGPIASRTAATSCTCSSFPQIRARSKSVVSPSVGGRSTRSPSSASSTRVSSAVSAAASRLSTARCTDVRTAARTASAAISAGAGSARSGRRRSRSASCRSSRPRSQSVSAGRGGG